MKSLGIVFWFVVGLTLVSVIVTLVWLQFAPIYTSTAVLEVRPQPESALAPREETYSVEHLEALAARDAGLVCSEATLETAVMDERVRDTDWFRRSPEDAVDRLYENLEVQIDGALIFVSLTGMEARELPEIVSAVAEAAAESSREFAISEARARIGRLIDVRETLAKQRDMIREEKARLLRDAKVPGMLDRANVLTSRLRALASRVDELERELADANNAIERGRKAIRSDEIERWPAVLQALDQDPVLSAMEVMRTETRIELAVEAAMGRKSPSRIPPRRPGPLPPLPPAKPKAPNTQPADRARATAESSKLNVDTALRELGEGLSVSAVKPAPASPATRPADPLATRPAAKAERWIYSGGRWIRASQAGADKRVARGSKAGAKDDRADPPSVRSSPLPDPLKLRLAAIEKEIEARRKIVTNAAVASTMAAAESRKADVLIRLTRAREEYRYIEVSVRGLQAARSAHNELTEREDDLSKPLREIDGRLMDLQIVASAIRPLQVRHPAGTPREASMPRWQSTLPIGAIAGLVIGLAVAVSRAVSRRRRGAVAPTERLSEDDGAEAPADPAALDGAGQDLSDEERSAG